MIEMVDEEDPGPTVRHGVNLLKGNCPHCGRLLTQGEWEAAGFCVDCYFKALNE